MQGIEILVVTLAAFFGLGIFFAILVWCRSWQREYREQSDRQFQTLRAQSDRLRDAIEMLDHTAASLLTADGQLTRQLEDLRSSVQKLQNMRPDSKPELAETIRTVRPEPTTNDASSQSDAHESTPATGDRYDDVQALLKEGRSTVEIAHELDIGVAEVRMIARMKAIKSPDRST